MGEPATLYQSIVDEQTVFGALLLAIVFGRIRMLQQQPQQQGQDQMKNNDSDQNNSHNG